MFLSYQSRARDYTALSSMSPVLVKTANVHAVSIQLQLLLDSGATVALNSVSAM